MAKSRKKIPKPKPQPEMVYTLTVIGHDDYDFAEAMRRQIESIEVLGCLRNVERFTADDGSEVTVTCHGTSFIED